MSLEQLEAQALQLPPEQRAQLAQRLIFSLDEDPDIEQAWLQLADERYAQVCSGEMGTVPAEEAIEAARKSLGRG